MTERLYYTDSNLTEFEATITGNGVSGDRFWLTLDRTAFYPTSGGQLHDRGTIEGVSVVDVTESETGDILHHSEAAIGSVGQQMNCVIDSARRRRSRQQHTGQHILSRVFIDMSGHETVSVHLGEEYGAVELNVTELSPEAITEAEEEANRIISSSCPVTIIFAEQNELGRYPLRKPPDRSGTIRIVRIGDLDWSACGGTHCNNTAEVGMLKIVGIEKQRGNLLVKFLTGDLTLKDYRARYDIIERLARQLTCHRDDIESRISKLDADYRQSKKDVGLLRKQLLPVKATELAVNAKICGEHRVVAEQLSDSDAAMANELAPMIASDINGLVMLLYGDRGVIAIDGSDTLNAKELAEQLIERYSLKGGGNKQRASLSGITPEKVSEILNTLHELAERE